MQPRIPPVLEFDRIRDILCGLALTPLGRERLASLHPSAEMARVQTALDATTEGTRFLRDNGGLPLRASDDVPDTLMALAIDGRALEPLQLVALADLFDSLDRSVAAITPRSADAFPILRSVADGAPSLARETAAVRRAIDAHGDVRDDASPRLQQIREQLRRQRARLRGTLESYVRGRDTSRYLQEHVVTERNGRFVLIVRAEHRQAIPGIVHGSSSSGASLYLEPLSTVEVNNDIVALEEREAAEIHAVLLALTSGFRARAADVHAALDAIVELDTLQARARLSELTGGVCPDLSSEGVLDLKRARHPLLIPAVRRRLPQPDDSRAFEPVPIDLVLRPPARALVISGPNTGGKTVALKTAGLLVAMAQSGLHVPADAGSQLPVCRSIFADIGDEQSIASSLSTFSGHIANIVQMDRRLELPALVLLDEVGAGTDPAEGGALGVAIIEHFRRRGALVVATTHYDVLKSYASTTEGVTSAAFGFDPDTFAPTFRLVYGTPGSSLAFEVARRLGLPSSVVEAATAQRSEQEARLAAHLARVDREINALEHERRLVSRQRTELESREQAARVREEAIQARERELGRRVDRDVTSHVREARLEIDRVVERLKRQTETLTNEARRRTAAGLPALSTGEAGSVRMAAREAVDSVAARHVGKSRADGEASQTGAGGGPPAASVGVRPAAGSRVRLVPLGVEGEVQLVRGDDAELLVHGKRLRVPLRSLVLLDAPAPRSRVEVNVQVRTEESTASDLNVIGRTVDEALDLADRFLDRALVDERHVVRVIHGHGSGQLRRALGEFFRSHPLVARHAPAPREQGGEGVTVVELKE